MKSDFYIDRVDKEYSKNLLYNYHYLKDESKDFKSGYNYGLFRHTDWDCPLNIGGWAKQLDIDIGVFCALHTYGRKLNWNVHIHLSVTRGGLCKKTGLWKPIFFKAKTTEKCWRSAITQLLSSNYSELDLSGEGCPFIRNEQDWSRFLTSQYCRRWKLYP